MGKLLTRRRRCSFPWRPSTGRLWDWWGSSGKKSRESLQPVSYTHLDVYKRQVSLCEKDVLFTCHIIFALEFHWYQPFWKQISSSFYHVPFRFPRHVIFFIDQFIKNTDIFPKTKNICKIQWVWEYWTFFVKGWEGGFQAFMDSLRLWEAANVENFADISRKKQNVCKNLSLSELAALRTGLVPSEKSSNCFRSLWIYLNFWI